MRLLLILGDEPMRLRRICVWTTRSQYYNGHEMPLLHHIMEVVVQDTGPFGSSAWGQRTLTSKLSNMPGTLLMKTRLHGSRVLGRETRHG